MSSVWRMVAAFGLLNIVLLRLGAFSRESAMRRLSRRLGLVVRAIEFADGALAVDVDNERTYRVCEEILARRAAITQIAGSPSPPERHGIAVTPTIEPHKITDEARESVRMLFMAKHALWGGGMHPEDGNHAIYHHEVRTTLESLQLNLTLADKYDVLFESPTSTSCFRC
jgi:hypothetical protein